MAPLKRVVVALVLLVVAVQLVSGSQAAARGAEDAELGMVAHGVTNGFLGDGYIGCLEMGFSRCFADPTLLCLEDAMVECSLQAAAAPTAAAAMTAGPTAPLAGGGAEAVESLVIGAIGGVITHGIATLGAKYIDCVEVDLAAKCFLDPTIACVEKAMAAC